MKSFLVGLAVGVPIGMLMADMRAGYGDEIERRIRTAVGMELRTAHSDGDRIASAVNRVAEQAREGASNERNEAAINRVAREELLAVYGIGPVLAQRILDGRPYRDDLEVVERGILNQQTFDQLHRQVLVKHRQSA
jgi:DNA uptake protein ComE-like DNA-binding protein